MDMLFVMLSLELIIFFFKNPFSGVLKRGYLVEFSETFSFVFLSLLFSVTYLFVIKSGNEYSRIVFFLTYLIYFIISYTTRVIWKNILLGKAQNASVNGDKSLLIICRKKEAESVVQNITKQNYSFYNLSGLCIVDSSMIGNSIANCPVVADKDSVLNYISTNWIDEIFLATDIAELSKETIDGIMITGIPVHFRINEISGLESKVQTIDKLGPYNTITASNRVYNDSDLFLKRMMDITGGLVGCFFTLLLILIIGPIIYMKSPGPIIYVSDRVGKNGKIFKFYKFRSMVMNADDLKDELRKQNRNKDGMMFKIKDDPRIIPGIGHFIRKTSLDEFPQFFNVLKGDMSLVGTRPPTLDEWQKYSPYYRSRLSVKPGITGMWQISGRSNITDFDEVVKLDNEYINNWSINLDIKILFKTILYLFKGGDDAM